MLMVIIVFVAVLLVLTWCMIRVSSKNSRIEETMEWKGNDENGTN
jgi:heme/copper-type cytochrome/quinol oxidase subunit 2